MITRGRREHGALADLKLKITRVLSASTVMNANDEKEAETMKNCISHSKTQP